MANATTPVIQINEGNVGIGTSTPNAKLDIQGTQGQLFSVTDNLSGSIFAVADISGVPIFDVNSNGTSVFDGSVGIGGATETNRELKVHGHTLVDGTIYASGASNGYSIEVGQSRTTEGVAFLDLTGEVAPDDYGLRMIRYGGLNAESKIIHTGTANLTINAENGGDTVFTNTNVGIGVTATNYKLEVGGNVNFQGSFSLGVGTKYYTIASFQSEAYIYGSATGDTIHFGQPASYVQNISVQGTATATNFILSSDERLKENIEKACDNRIKADWKTFELKTDKGQKRYGVIAQELEKTNPEFVREDTQGFKSVAYIDLLIAKIAELEARLEKLEK